MQTSTALKSLASTDIGKQSTMSINRRNFIHSSAAGAAAWSLFSALLSAAMKSSEEPDQRVGFAIVELGEFSMGQMLPNFKNTQHCRPTALVSGSPKKQRRIAMEYGISSSHLYSYDNMDRIVDDATVDVVYVALPTGLHAEYTIRALEAGKHVLCEKPMATTVEECRAMIAAAEKAKRMLMIAYRVRFEPHN